MHLSHKTHCWLLIYLLALLFSIALLIRAWSELSTVLFVIGLALAALAVLGLAYVITRLVLDLRQRALDVRAREQQLLIEQEKHEAELRQIEQRLDLEQRRAALEERLALTRIPADALGNYASLLTPEGGILTLPPGNPAFAPTRSKGDPILPAIAPPALMPVVTDPREVSTSTRPPSPPVEPSGTPAGKRLEAAADARPEASESGMLSLQARMVSALLKQRKGQNEIIEALWGATGGRAYQEAVQEYREIVAQLLERGA